ncbi:MAG: hypothetical protein AB9882_09555 [Ignavibacteriaceae bacterium]
MILNALHKSGVLRKLTEIILPVIFLLNLLTFGNVPHTEKSNTIDPVITSLVSSDFNNFAVRTNNPEKTQTPDWIKDIERDLRKKTKITEISQLSKNNFAHLISFKTFLTAYLFTDT